MRSIELRLVAPFLVSFALVALHTRHARAQDPADNALVSEDHAVELHDGPVTISPIVLVQTQIAPYVGTDARLQAGDPAERAGFRMRRARFGFEGTVTDRVPFAISVELASDPSFASPLVDAWVGYRHAPWAELYVGAHKVPFSRSALTEPGKGALIERPFVVQAMAPFRQVGAHVEGRILDGRIGYALGVFNALQRSDQFYVGYVENAAPLGNRFDNLAYAVRITAEPRKSLGSWIPDVSCSSPRIGAGASYFFSNGGSRNIHGGGVDALLHARGFHALGEILWNRAVPRDTPTQTIGEVTTIQSVGGVLEAGYFARAMNSGLAARFEWIDPDTSVRGAGEGWIVAGGVNHLLVDDHLRVAVDYTHRQEIYVPQIKNDTLIVQVQLSL